MAPERLSASRPSASRLVGTTSNVPIIIPNGSAVKPIEFLARIRNDCNMLSRLFQTDPELAEVALRNDLSQLHALLGKRHGRFVLRPRLLGEYYPKIQQHEELALRYADPFDDEAQEEMKAAICRKGIDKNCTEVFKFNPKAFGRVVMPFVEMRIRNIRLKALVDSCAPLTIMSKRRAKECGLLSFLDQHYKCIADGVDPSKILGRIHCTMIKIGDDGYPCSIVVVDSPNREFIFGLDMILKHKCLVDFYANRIRIGDAGIPVPFVPGYDSSKDLASCDVDEVLTTRYRDIEKGDEILPCYLILSRSYFEGEKFEIFQVIIDYIDDTGYDLYGKITIESQDDVHDLYDRGIENCERIKPGQCISLIGPTKYIDASDSSFSIEAKLKLKGTNYTIDEKLYCFDCCNPELYGVLHQEILAGRYFSATVSFVAWSFAAEAVVEVRLIEGDGTVYGLLHAGSDVLNERPTTTLFKKSRKECIKVPDTKVIELSRSIVAVKVDSTLIFYANLKDHSDREVAIGVVEFPIQITGTFRKFLFGEHGRIEVRITLS